MYYKSNVSNKNKRQAKTCRVGSLIADTITPICQQNGFIQARILLEWDYIVTPQFAQFCIPLKLTFPVQQRHNGSLLLKATSSMATEISYLEPLIISRINQYFGYQAISKLRVLQGPIPQRSLLKKRPQKPLEPGVQASLQIYVQPVEDEDLRAALLSLGIGLYKKEKE